MSYNKITNPTTGKKVSIYGKKGYNIIKGYYNFLIKNEQTTQKGGMVVTNLNDAPQDSLRMVSADMTGATLSRKSCETSEDDRNASELFRNP